MVRKKTDRSKSSKKSPQQKAIITIKTKGSSEDFTLKKSVMKLFTKQKNDKTMCQCCKEYFLPHFFDVDHIHGKQEISSVKQLQMIDYSPKKHGKSLLKWLMTHKDKKIIYKHFQMLCINCNRAKFLYKTCPHQR